MATLCGETQAPAVGSRIHLVPRDVERTRASKFTSLCLPVSQDTEGPLSHLAQAAKAQLPFLRGVFLRHDARATMIADYGTTAG
jgi:hypothetical protein